MNRLRGHLQSKKIGRTCKRYVTALGKQVIALALNLKSLQIIRMLPAQPAD